MELHIYFIRNSEIKPTLIQISGLSITGGRLYWRPLRLSSAIWYEPVYVEPSQVGSQLRRGCRFIHSLDSRLLVLDLATAAAWRDITVDAVVNSTSIAVLSARQTSFVIESMRRVHPNRDLVSHSLPSLWIRLFRYHLLFTFSAQLEGRSIR